MKQKRYRVNKAIVSLANKFYLISVVDNDVLLKLKS